jgi:hypothetical protein
LKTADYYRRFLIYETGNILFVNFSSSSISFCNTVLLFKLFLPSQVVQELSHLPEASNLKLLLAD